MTTVPFNENAIDKEAYFFKSLPWTREWTFKDVSVVDSLLKDLQAGAPKEKKVVFHILTQFVKEKDAWKRCSDILDFSSCQKTKYFILSVLREFIKARWKSLSCRQSEDFKKYILNLVVKRTEVNELSGENRILLDILNTILLQVVEYDYPTKWPTFFEEFLSGDRSNTVRCLNSLVILNYMGKKVLETGNHRGWLKAKAIQDAKPVIFPHIFLSCQFALATSSDSKLLNYAFETLIRYVVWIPAIFIYGTNFIEFLIHRLNVVHNRCTAMQLLIKIVHIAPKTYTNKLANAFTLFMTYQVQLLSPSGNYKEACTNSPLYKEKIKCLTLFLCTILNKCGLLLRRIDFDSFDNALNYLVSISEIDDPNLLKFCMDYFDKFLPHLCCDKVKNYIYNHSPAMSRLRNLIITKISEPEKIIVKCKKENVFKVIYKDADAVETYRYMRRILVFLTYLDYADTVKIIIEKLCNEINNCGLSAKNLNSLCWAAVLIRGKIVKVRKVVKRCMPREEEKKLFWTIIKGLLALGKLERARNNKIIIAHNLMYVIGEYAAYLNSRWDILKMVLIKLFDFMHDKRNDSTTKTLACKTFICIAQKCKKMLIEVQPGETMPYFDKILKRMRRILTRLQPQQVFYFYEAVGYIAVASSPSVKEKIIKERILKLMAPQNDKWELVLNQARKPGEIFLTPRHIRELIYFLRINRSACKSIGFRYRYQFHIIYKEMLVVLYEKISKRIRTEVVKKKIDVKRPWIKIMIHVKKEILKLICVWISLIKKKSQCGVFLQYFLPYLLKYVLIDYYSCPVPSLCEPEVFSILTTTVNSLKAHATNKVETFCSFILCPTVYIIRKNREEFPEIQKNFLMFVHAVTTHCFEALAEMFSLTPNLGFRIILGLTVQSTYHKRINATLGLQTLQLLLEKIHHSSIAQQFYQIFYLRIFKNIVFLVISPLFRSGLKYKAHILSHMLSLIVKKEIKGPINPAEQNRFKVPNSVYIKFCIADFVHKEFPLLTEGQLNFVTSRLFRYHVKVPCLIEYLKNLPIICKEFTDIMKNKQKTAAVQKMSEKKECTDTNKQKTADAKEMSEKKEFPERNNQQTTAAKKRTQMMAFIERNKQNAGAVESSLRKAFSERNQLQIAAKKRAEIKAFSERNKQNIAAKLRSHRKAISERNKIQIAAAKERTKIKAFSERKKKKIAALLLAAKKRCQRKAFFERKKQKMAALLIAARKRSERKAFSERNQLQVAAAKKMSERNAYP